LKPLVFRGCSAPGSDTFGFEFVGKVHSCIASSAVPSATWRRSKQSVKRKGKKTKNAEFFSPTSSVEDAEKALSGSLKSQPTPRGVEQGAAGGKTKTKYLARNDDNRNCKAFFSTS